MIFYEFGEQKTRLIIRIPGDQLNFKTDKSTNFMTSEHVFIIFRWPLHSVAKFRFFKTCEQ